MKKITTNIDNKRIELWIDNDSNLIEINVNERTFTIAPQDLYTVENDNSIQLQQAKLYAKKIIEKHKIKLKENKYAA